MSVSIKVCIRCRPFSCENKLGVHMVQTSEEDGEVNLLNSTYTTKRFGFSWAWWSAHGWQRYCRSDEHLAKGMKVIDQNLAYAVVGTKVKKDLLSGNAVVIFAYGLSGSGKTFTVFGPDAVDIPEAWFKWAQPHPLWGVYPRLAYDIFNMKEDTWKINMKYFQNVVNIVRDLMSPTTEERVYKEGMRKDQDGFTDILWCQSAVLNDWNHLRATFKRANARKAISPTQFNHQSTRGHCIMTLEVKMPVDGDVTMMQRGRVYICDLAGTEPAGDIVYASYKKIVYPDGEIEHKYVGPHPDQSKTKNLQNQGKKINLSLSEMAQFFMKMAQAIKKKRLGPGKTIPGCNSYFLCKYLKDTMLQARTYLFCAIRPEVKFHTYTFSTLVFAKNASVIKLNPKKATVAATPAERKLMEELQRLKVMFEQLQEENERMKRSLDPNAVKLSDERSQELEDTIKERDRLKDELAELHGTMQRERDQLVSRQQDVAAELAEMEAMGDDMDEDTRQRMLAKKKELQKLQFQEEQMKANHADRKQQAEAGLANIKGQLKRSFTEDERKMVQSNVQMKKMMQEKRKSIMAAFGGGGVDPAKAKQDAKMEDMRREYKVKGIALTYFEENTQDPHLINLDEDTFRSKRHLYFLTKHATWFGPKGDVRPLSLNVVRKHCCIEFGTEGHILVGGNGEVYHNGKKVRKGVKIPLQIFDRVVIGGEVTLYRYPSRDQPAWPEPDADRAVSEYQKALRKRDKKSSKSHSDDEELLPNAVLSPETKLKRAMKQLDREMTAMIPKTKSLKKLMGMLGRPELSFETCLYKNVISTDDETKNKPVIKVKVSNGTSKTHVYIDSFEFLKGFSMMQDEMYRLRSAIDNEREYKISEFQDPTAVFFGKTSHVGSAIVFPEYLAHLLETDPEELEVVIGSSVETQETVGKLKVSFTPLVSPDDDETALPIEDYIEDPKDLIGREATFKCEVRNAVGLPFLISKAYVQYNFFGELFTTGTVESSLGARELDFRYSFVHHIPTVTQEFLDWLQNPLEFQVLLAVHIDFEKLQAISTADHSLQQRVTGKLSKRKKKSKSKQKSSSKTNSNAQDVIRRLQMEKRELQAKLSKATQQLAKLHVQSPDSPAKSITGSKLGAARFSDEFLNSNSAAKQEAIFQEWRSKRFKFRHRNTGAVVSALASGGALDQASISLAKKIIADGGFDPVT